jgi:hypothetical protein
MDLTRNRIQSIILSSFPLLIASAVSWLIVENSLVGETIASSEPYTISQLITQALVSTILGTLVVISLFWMMHRRGRRTRKFVVALVVSPILYFVSIFLGQAFLLILFKGSTGIFQGLLMIFSLGVSMLSIALIVIDAIPPKLRNLFVAFYGSIFGIFLGVTFVTSTMFVLIVTLIAEDYLLTRYSPTPPAPTLGGKIGEDPFDYTRIQSDAVAIGVGDYIAFSLIASHAVAFMPVYVWVSSILLGLLGVFVNIGIIAKEEQVLPAIPLPAFLAVFPWVIHVLALVVMVPIL